ncbi:hypothetical protein ACQY0O_002365 [Thecaphora frezii]
MFPCTPRTFFSISVVPPRSATSSAFSSMLVPSSYGERQPLLQPPLHLPQYAADLKSKRWPRRSVCSTANFAATLAFLALLFFDLVFFSRLVRPSFPVSHVSTGTHAGVAAEDERCSRIGLDAIKDGGSAVDAAIASTLCIGTVNMFSAGIGGGGFMVVHQAGADAATAIDFRETAPAQSSPTMYDRDPELARYGALAPGVPGELKALEYAHRKWGRLPWSRLVLPSIRLAEETYVSTELARRLRIFGSFMRDRPEWLDVFADAEGKLLAEGHRIRRTSYAETLRLVAEEGAEALYNGTIGADLVRFNKEQGGILTLSDLQNYTLRVTPALSRRVGDQTLFTTPAPSGGPLLAHLLLASYYRSKRNAAPQLRSEQLHTEVELVKFAMGYRLHVGDPAFLDGPSLSRLSDLSSPASAERTASLVDGNRTHTPSYYLPPSAPTSAYGQLPNDWGTSHVSAADAHGLSVSITSSINHNFGSQLLDPTTGIILNDQMSDFSTLPLNRPAPSKRPLSSISPLVLTSPSRTVVVGGSGGLRIFSSVFQTVRNLELRPRSPGKSIDVARFHHALVPNRLEIEEGESVKTLRELAAKGHDVDVRGRMEAKAEVQLVVVERPQEHGGEGKGKGKSKGKGKVWAVSDVRKHARAAAY